MNKNVIITGAAKGIGKAIALRLISENYHVIITDIDRESGEQFQSEYPDQITFYELNITDESAVASFFEHYWEEYKTLYALVNNAGIIRDNMIWKMPLSDFNTVIDVNLKGSWLMCKMVSEKMKEQHSGRIVNISSRAWLGNRGQSNYAASKAGIIGLTRVLALELGKYKVTVNTVAPGLINTPMTQKLKPEVLQTLINSQPTKTAGQPEDVAHAVAFFLHEQSGFITGQTLYVDGGKSIGAGI